VPWAVACVYRDEASGNIFQRLDLVPAHDQGSAAAQAASMYYLSGGSLPLFAVMAVAVPEELCRHAVAMYDETARLKKAEADKVVNPFQLVQREAPEGAT
jgi:hypothetical protein